MFRIYLLLVNIFLVAKGFSGAKCCEEKILICGVIKNGAKGFPTVKKYAEEVGSKFLDYRVIVYENNSTDNTKELYSSWARENAKVVFISEDLTQQFIDNFTPKCGDYRTEFIARARNIVLDRALNKEFDDFQYHIMVDLDSFDSWPAEEIFNTIEHPSKEWDAVCANGSYDLYALRSNEFRISYDMLEDKYDNFLKLIGFSFGKILINPYWYQVESAFGGLAIYKRESIKNCFYSGLLSLKYMDKIFKTDYMTDVLVINFKKKINCIIQKKFKVLKKWVSYELDKNFLPPNPYICEHVQFHHQMILNGYDKIYINPKLKMISLEHPNY